MRPVQFALVPVVLALLAGCPQTYKPETPTESIAVAYASIQAVANTATLRLQAGRITAEQAGRISAKLDEALKTTRTAEGILAQGGDPHDTLALATAILTALENEMAPVQ